MSELSPAAAQTTRSPKRQSIASMKPIDAAFRVKSSTKTLRQNAARRGTLFAFPYPACVDDDGMWPNEDQMRQGAEVCRKPMKAVISASSTVRGDVRALT